MTGSRGGASGASVASSAIFKMNWDDDHMYIQFLCKTNNNKNDITIDKIEIITQKVGTYSNICIKLAPNRTQGNLFLEKIFLNMQYGI